MSPKARSILQLRLFALQRDFVADVYQGPNDSNFTLQSEWQLNEEFVLSGSANNWIIQVTSNFNNKVTYFRQHTIVSAKCLWRNQHNKKLVRNQKSRTACCEIMPGNVVVCCLLLPWLQCAVQQVKTAQMVFSAQLSVTTNRVALSRQTWHGHLKEEAARRPKWTAIKFDGVEWWI